MGNALEHPAAKNFNPYLAGGQHIAEKGLKWGAIGAIAGGVLAAGAGVLGLGSLGGGMVAIGLALQPTVVGAPIGWALMALGTAIGMGGGFAAMPSLLAAGAIAGGKLGAMFGGLVGVSGVSGAVQEKYDDAIAQHNGMEMRQRQQQAWAMQQQMQQAQVMNQNQALGMGQGVSSGLGGMPQVGRGNQIG